MSSALARTTLQLAAIDLDGTLLGPDGTISRTNRDALHRLRAAGVHLVLASGRHHLTMRPYFADVPDLEWLVCAQGAEVSDVGRRTIIAQHFLTDADARTLVDLAGRLELTCVAYAKDSLHATRDNDVWVPFYARLSGLAPIVTPVRAFAGLEIFKLLWLGDAPRLDALAHEPALAPFAEMQVRTHEKIVEFLPRGVSKGTGVAALANHLGIPAEATVAFGDAENDIPLFAWAGLSVAMPHGWIEAQRRASFIAPEGPPETALARAIDLLLADRSTRRAGNRAR